MKIEVDSAKGRTSNYVDHDNGEDDEESDGGVGVESFEDSGDDGKIGSDSRPPAPASTLPHCSLSVHTMQDIIVLSCRKIQCNTHRSLLCIAVQSLISHCRKCTVQ